MSFAENILVKIDVIADKAVKDIKSLKSATSEAEGFFGKMGAGAKASMGLVNEHAKLLAATAGTALIGFAVKSTEAFEQTAEAAKHLANATGLSLEQSSRWTDVGKRFNVTAEDIGKAVGKIDKQIDNNKWAKYGIDTHDASGQVKDANTLLLDAMSTLSNIADPTARAAAGYDLFGKSFASIAPLLGHTRDEYQKMLGSVKDGNIVTEEAVAKAEALKAAQVSLKDAFQAVEMQVGGVVAGLSPLITGMGKVLGFAGKGLSALFGQDAKDTTPAVHELTKALEKQSSAGANAYSTLAEFGSLMDKTGNSASTLGKVGTAFADAFGGATRVSRNFNQAWHKLVDTAPESARRVYIAMQEMYAQSKQPIDGMTAQQIALRDAAADNVKTFELTPGKLAAMAQQTENVDVKQGSLLQTLRKSEDGFTKHNLKIDEASQAYYNLQAQLDKLATEDFTRQFGSQVEGAISARYTLERQEEQSVQDQKKLHHSKNAEDQRTLVEDAIALGDKLAAANKAKADERHTIYTEEQQRLDKIAGLTISLKGLEPGSKAYQDIADIIKELQKIPSDITTVLHYVGDYSKAGPLGTVGGIASADGLNGGSGAYERAWYYNHPFTPGMSQIARGADTSNLGNSPSGVPLSQFQGGSVMWAAPGSVVPVTASAHIGGGVATPTPARRASGGPIDGPTLVGEHGPEIFDPNLKRIQPNTFGLPQNNQGHTTNNITINMPTGSPDDVAAQIARFNRRNGR